MGRRAIIAAFSVISLLVLTWAATRDYGEVTVTTVLRVYDGDTFFANIAGWPPIIGDDIGIRIGGVDTPEIEGDSDYERELARKAKLYAENRLRKAKTVKLRRLRRDKYFRILADVYVDKDNLARELIRVGLGVEYEGGKKHQW